MGAEEAIGSMVGAGLVAGVGIATMGMVSRSVNRMGSPRRRTTRRRSKRRSGF
jgi:hypothetical protein